MDCGLGNYATVKNFVLTAGMAASADTEYDSVLQIIARGVAERFERYCNRKFGYVVNDVCRFPANRSHYYLPRYPFQSIASLTLRATAQDPWQDVSTAIVQMDELIGLIDFYVILADEMSLLECTYTGGFWYETKEPTDEGYPTEVPEGEIPGGTPLVPASLQQAWLFQTLHEFQSKDRLLPEGLGAENKSRRPQLFEQMVLLPEVQNTLDQFYRFQNV